MKSAFRALINANDATANQRGAQVGNSMGKSSDLFGDDSRRGTTVVGNYFSERELREEFSDLIAGYTALQLANASGCGIDAAKKWLARKGLPNTASTFNMAQRMPVVRDWALRKMGVGGEAQIRSLKQFIADQVAEELHKKPATASVKQVTQQQRGKHGSQS